MNNRTLKYEDVDRIFMKIMTKETTLILSLIIFDTSIVISSPLLHIEFIFDSLNSYQIVNEGPLKNLALPQKMISFFPL